MDENIIKHDGGIAIVNGGNPIEGCPKDWDEAKEIQKNLNIDKDWEHGEFVSQPVWSFDCGFKLDFDGPLIRVSSRFYPPKTHYGPTWDGTVSIIFMNEDIAEKKFDCATLEELKLQVDEYLKTIADKLRTALL